MQDHPTGPELLRVVERFLEDEVVPALEGPAKFHARIAANVMRILERELRLEPDHLLDEWSRLNEVLGTAEPPPTDSEALRQGIRARTEVLCQRIREGATRDESWRRAVLAHVRKTVEEKLAVANPRFLGRHARAQR